MSIRASMALAVVATFAFATGAADADDGDTLAKPTDKQANEHL